MADETPTVNDLGEIQNEIASEFGGTAPRPAVSSNSPSPAESGFDTVGDTVYQNVGHGPDGQPIWKGPDGEVLPQAQLQQKKAELEKYGSTSGVIAASALGGARGLSFGLSDVAARVLGIDAETLRKIKEINPKASTISEIASIAATLIPTGGSSAGAAAAEGAGALTRAASAAGRIGEELTASGLEQFASRSAARQILANTMAKGLGSATEGALYGGGQVVSDTALGDPEMNGEKALATVGLSAVLGGGIGSSLSFLGDVAPSIIDKGRAASQKVQETLDKISGGVSDQIAERASQISGQPVESIRPLVGFDKESRELRAQAVAPKGVIEENKKELINSLGDLYDTGKQTTQELNKVRQTEIGALLKDEPVDPIAAKNQADDLATRMKAQLNQMRQEPEVYQATGKIRQAEQQFEALQNSLQEAKTPEEVFKVVNDAKVNLDPILDWDKKLKPEWSETMQQLTKIRTDMKNYLTDPEIFGGAAAAHADVNNVLSEYANITKKFEKRFMTLETQMGGRPQYEVSPEKLSRFLNDPIAARSLAKDELLQDYLSVQNKLHDLVDRMAKGPQEVGDQIQASPFLPGARGKSDAAAGQVQDKLKGLQASTTLKHIGHSNLVSTGEALGGAAAYHVLGLPGLAFAAAVNSLKHPANLVKAMARLERMLGNTSKTIGSAVDTFLSKNLTSSINRAVTPVGVKALDAIHFGPKEDNSGPQKKASYDQKLQQLANFISDPEHAATKVTEHLDPLHQVAPNIAQATQMKALNLATHLYQTAPKDPLAGQTMLPQHREFQPSDRDLAKWQRRVNVAENPLSILEDLKAGTLTREQVETFKEGYSKLYQEMTSTILDKITDLGTDLPFAKRNQLSILFGMPLDPSFQPSFIQAMQQNHQQMRPSMAQSAMGGKMPGANVSKLNLTNSKQTSLERIEAR